MIIYGRLEIGDIDGGGGGIAGIVTVRGRLSGGGVIFLALARLD